MVKHKVMRDIYQIMDMSLHLCKRDSCPNGAVEAIGAHLPIITTNCGGGAVELAKLTKGCIIAEGDRDTNEYDYPYRESFNILSDELKTNIVKAMVKIANDRRQVELPDQLRIDYVAKQYIDMFRRVLDGRSKR